MEAVDLSADPRLLTLVAEQKYPLLFCSLSGAHLYGCPSPDSDVDLRGAYVLPLDEVVGLRTGPETVEKSVPRDGMHIDLALHDVKKLFELLLKKNGAVLEDICSPLVLQTCGEHEELHDIALRCVTRNHVYHYLGFARSEWEHLEAASLPKVKGLLYVYRLLLTGLHLMRTGEVEANLERLNAGFHLPQIPELTARQRELGDHALLEAADLAWHGRENERLRHELELARDASSLPDGPSGKEALHDLLVRIRLRTRPDA